LGGVFEGGEEPVYLALHTFEPALKVRDAVL
jgi:hypothetical protein